MEFEGRTPRRSLEAQLATELTALLAATPVDAEFDVDPSSDLCSILELFITEVLCRRHPEWLWESLDGIFIARARRIGPACVELVGTGILISDQTVTPLRIALELAHSGEHLVKGLVCLGEAGGGPLGISGPPCNSKKARVLLMNVVHRLDRIDWSYRAVIGGV